MKITQKSVNYEITNGAEGEQEISLDFSVTHQHYQNGEPTTRISIRPLKGSEFKFQYSNPRQVRDIAQLMVAACEEAIKQEAEQAHRGGNRG